MKVYRHFAAGISGTINTEGIRERVVSDLPDVVISDTVLPGKIKAIKLNAISQGNLLDNSPVDFSVDAFIFAEGVIIFEISIEAGDDPSRFIEGSFLREKIRIVSEGIEKDDPLYMHCWSFMFNLLHFSDIVSDDSEMDMLDEWSHLKINETIWNTSLIRTCFLGENVYFETRADMNEETIVITTPQEKAALVMEGVWKSGDVWFVPENEQAALELRKYLLFQESILGVNSILLDKWLELLGEESIKIRNQLSETNKIYWTRLRTKLEIWDLNFLSILTALHRLLNLFRATEIPGLEPWFKEDTRTGLLQSEDLILRSIKEIRYGIENLRTPCDAHDEEILQKETEKGNERIMLLSFLAMSIPLLGAILAPGISPGTKLISAMVLISAPLIYQYVRKQQLRREANRAKIGYMRTRKSQLVEGIRRAEESIATVSRNPNLNEKTKRQTIEFVKKDMTNSIKAMKQIDRAIESLKR